jgi:hypothetical protein
VKSTFPATIAAPPAGFVAGCVRAMSLFGGDSNGKSSSQNEEIRRGSSGEPLYTTLAGHPVTDDNNRYVMPFFMSAERKLVVRQTFPKELQQGVLVLAFESVMENVCMCTSSLYISSIMRTLQSDDHIQDTYMLFLRLIDPESDGAAVSSLDGF